MSDIWAYCPLCDKVLDGDGVWDFMTRRCEDCDYTYQAHGSYASSATIGDEHFHFDDMFGDGEKFNARIKELREQPKIAESWKKYTNTN
jgi:hypothetical protein